MILLNKFIKYYIRLREDPPLSSYKAYIVAGKTKFTTYKYKGFYTVFHIKNGIKHHVITDLLLKNSQNYYCFDNRQIHLSIDRPGVTCIVGGGDYFICNGKNNAISNIEYHFNGFLTSDLNWHTYSITFDNFIEQYSRAYYNKDLPLLDENLW